jgi:hypothetical protein
MGNFPVANPAEENEKGPLTTDPSIASSSRQLRLWASGWQARPSQDEIVPTMPVADGQSEDLSAMREKLLQDQRATLPLALRDPVMVAGVTFEFAAAPNGEARSPHWRTGDGSVATGAWVREDRAELSWPATSLIRVGEFVLDDGRGRELAHITVEAGGVLLIRTARDLRAWYWVGIECAVTGPAAADRFTWRTLRGEASPAAWRIDRQWRDGAGQRVELPLDSAGPRAIHATLAFVDHLSGWALASALAVQAWPPPSH